MKAGDKIVCFTDIHLGLRNNERRHNIECARFVDWAIKEAHDFGAKYCVFLGDFHHYRNQIHVSTMNYSLGIFEQLGKSFEKTYLIVGNHDLPYKDKREINSIEFAKEIKNIQIINDITTVQDAVLSPWLIENEYKKFSKMGNPFIFGHFEIPGFLMNAMVAMPDIGRMTNNTFTGENQQIFSGHFHKRQVLENDHGSVITYIGNCFPHSFSDAGDDKRGIMLLELGSKPTFKSWPEAPKYRNLLLSKLLEDPSRHVDQFTTAKVNIDLDISYEEASFIKEMLIKDFNVRELKLIPNKNILDAQARDLEGVEFHSVDQIVLEQLKNIDSETLDKTLLVDIYREI